MVPLRSSVVLTPRLDQALCVRNVNPGVWGVLSSAQGSDWGLSGVQVDVSTMSQGTSVMQELSVLDRAASLSSSMCHLTLSQVNADVAFGKKHCIPAVPELSPSFGVNDNYPPFPPLAQEPDRSRCACQGFENCRGCVLTDAPMDASHANYEVFVYSSSSAPSATSRTVDPYLLTSSLNEDTKNNCETSGSDGFPPMDILRQYSDSAGPAAFLNEISSSDFAAWADNSSDFDFEVVRDVPLSAHLPLEQHLIVSEEAAYRCEWIDENGAVCGDKLHCSTLSGHLSMHGIKSMSRDMPTECRWVGCRRTKPMNRESIVRHVREVHLRVKRLPKVVQSSRS